MHHDGSDMVQERRTLLQESIVGQPAPSCSEVDNEVLAPLERVSEQILGKLGTNISQKPAERPLECQNATSLDELTSCYLVWGFKHEVAPCWAREAYSKKELCGEACGILDSSGTSFECVGCQVCQECFANQRKIKNECVYNAMNISDGCKQCELSAYEYYDNHCMMECVDAFTEFSPQQPSEQPSQQPPPQLPRPPSHRPSQQPFKRPFRWPSKWPSQQPSPQLPRPPSQLPSQLPSQQPFKRPFRWPPQRPSQWPSQQPFQRHSLGHSPWPFPWFSSQDSKQPPPQTVLLATDRCRKCNDIVQSALERCHTT